MVDRLENLNKIDLEELKEIGLNDETMRLAHCKSISAEEAEAKGFYFSNKHDNSNAINAQNVDSCLCYPILGEDGNPAIDPETKIERAWIKPRWKKDIKSEDLGYACNEKLPKYLGQSRFAASKQIIMYPPSLNHEAGYLLITEGPKKLYRAYQDGFNIIALPGVWNFADGKLKSSDLNHDLVNFAKNPNLKIIMAFDSDQSVKESVATSQEVLANMIYKATNKQIYNLNLPQRFEGKLTKGLDDFLQVAGKAELEKLIKNAHPIETDFIKALKANRLPLAPLTEQPEIFRRIIDDLQTKQEGPLEILSQVLHCSVAAVLRNRFTLNSKKAHLYSVGLADTSVGKSDIARQGMKALQQIDDELNREFKEVYSAYKQAVKSEDSEEVEKPKSKRIKIAQATRQGLTEYLTKYVEIPSGSYFALGEFEQHLANLNIERNKGLDSFYTELFDGGRLSTDLTKANLIEGDVMESVNDVSVSIGGLSTYSAFIDNLPPRAESSGSSARQAYYLGTDREIDVPIQGDLDSKYFQAFLFILKYLEKISREDISLDFKWNDKAREIWEKAYKQLKHEIRCKKDDPLNAPIKRKLTDYGVKFALIFEVAERTCQNLLDCFSYEKISLGLSDTELALFFEKNIFENLEISEQSLNWALSWSYYFMETDRYVYGMILNKHDKSFDDWKSKIIKTLQNYPEGLLKSQLRNIAKLPRFQNSGKYMSEVLKELKESNTIEIIKKAKSELIKLKPYFC